MTRIRVRVPLLALGLLLAGSAYGWDFSVSVNGNDIVVNVTGMDNTTSRQTCAGAGVDLPGGGAHCGIPGLSSDTITVGCNRLGPHTVFVEVFDSTTNGQYETRLASADVTTPPSAGCPEYTFSASTFKALTHKYGAENYPTGQERDSQVLLYFKPIRVDPAVTFYGRVFDAKEGSTYRTSTNPNGDNIDTAAGKLAFSPSDTGSRDINFQAGTAPVKTMYLNTTGFAAGDNYTVAVTADPNLVSDPNFVCNTSPGCQQAGPITAWKRVYLEKKQMFRNGVFVAGSAVAGTNQVLVQIPAGLRWRNVVLRAGDSVRLLHAQRFDGLDFFPDYHWEDAMITAVDRVAGFRNRRLLTLATPLSYSYTEDTSYATALDDGVSDGAGNLAAGTYGRNEAYLGNTFAQAYVEFFSVPQSVREIPYLPVVRREAHVANKWFENTTINLLTRARPGNSNVKHILAGSGSPENSTSTQPSTSDFGSTGIAMSVPPPPGVDVIPQPNFSWTWVGGIERAVMQSGNAVRNLDPWIFNGENLVHEVAHGFNVNSVFYFAGDFGHCSRTMAGNPSLNCRMRSSQDPLYVAAQNADGIVGFHYSSDSDSEYMTIRTAMEPLATPIR